MQFIDNQFFCKTDLALFPKIENSGNNASGQSFCKISLLLFKANKL